jgi:hypothetical protein
MSRRFQAILKFPLYPLLLSLSFPLGLLTDNTYMFRARRVDFILAFTFAFWAVVYAPIRLALRRSPHKAGLLTAFVMVLFLLPYPWLYLILKPLSTGNFLPGVIGASLFGLACYIAADRMREKFTAIANVGTAAALLVPISSVLGVWLGESGPPKSFAAEPAPFAAAAATPAAPDIYHIVTDGMSGAAVMREVYGHDTGPFYEALRRRGFAVAMQAHPPYNMTLLSLGATFQGQYLAPAKIAAASHSGDRLRAELAKVAVDGPVHRALRRLGYRFLATTTGTADFFRFPPETEVIEPPGGARHWMFEHHYFRHTRLSAISSFHNIFSRANRRALNDDIRHALKTAPTRAPDAGAAPIHFYEHLLAPHPPFSLDRNGDDDFKSFGHFAFMNDGQLEWRPELRPEYRAGYVEKTLFVEDRLIRQIDHILAASDAPKLIVLQSDHGGGLYYASNALKYTCLKERYGSFLAIYASDPKVHAYFDKALTRPYNTVNLYRDVFRLYFGAGTAPLPPESYYVGWTSTEPVRLEPDALTPDCPTG